MKAMLLAAGLGTRFRPHTNILPKPALPFCNQPLIHYSLKLIESFNPTLLAINTHHLPQNMTQLFNSPVFTNLKTQFFHEAPTILGSGGGIGNARSALFGDGNFVVCNADEMIVPRSSDCLQKMWEFHQEKKSICTLLTMKHPEVGSKFGGVWINPQNQILGFGKTPITGSTSGLHYVGLMILSDKIFHYIPQGVESNILYDAVSNAIQDHQTAYAYQEDSLWFEIGNIKDYLNAHKNIIYHYEKYKNEFAWFEKLFPNPPQKLDQAMGFIGKNVKHLDYVTAKGFVSIGDNVNFQSHVELEDCVINARSQVLTDKKIQNNLTL